MRVVLRKFKRVLSKAEQLIPKKNAASLRRLEEFAVQASNGLRKRSFNTLKVADMLALTGLAKTNSEIRQFYALVSVIKPLGHLEKLEELKALRRAKAVSPRQVRNKRIPTSEDFTETCSSLESRGLLIERLLLLVMAASGRRQIDVTRLALEHIDVIGKLKYRFRLDFDKKNRHPVYGMIDFNSIPPEYVPGSLADIDDEFRMAFRLERRPFKEVSAKNFSRRIKLFRPHSIRSLVAIHLTWLGLNDTRIKKTIPFKLCWGKYLYSIISQMI